MYAKVIVDIPEVKPFDYKVPDEMLLAQGDRVLVGVGTRKVVGIVVELSSTTSYEGSLKSVLKVFNDTAPLREEWLALTQFASKYYVRGWGEAALPAIPKFFRRESRRGYQQRMEKFRAPKPRYTKPQPAPILHPEQQEAVKRITQAKGYAPFVLFGVTGSGKTEVYLHVIETVLKRDPQAQVLLLVPEINLTPQLEARVRARFPEETIVTLHSSCSELERADAWLAIHEGRARILVGTRMSAMASFRDLKLIIVDEEHDGSFKAGDGLRHSARDLAVWRAWKNQIPIVLGSATPSMETWYKAKLGDYQLIELTHRATGTGGLPEVELTEAPKVGQPALTAYTQQQVQQTIDRNEQVLIFLNRRGYSPVLYCPSCGWMATCTHCSARMVYHKEWRVLMCHHCGTRKPIPRSCPECGNVDILPKGQGTEQIEESIEKLFSGARVMRIDRDTVSGKGEVEAAFQRFHAKEAEIMVGTQMIAKGHDFKNVGLVVVLDADAQLTHPDVRAREQLFATFMQVAGRSGRGNTEGHVLIQTHYPNDPFFAMLKLQDYRKFAEFTLAEREINHYVPYSYQAILYAEAESIGEALNFLSDMVTLGSQLPEASAVRLFDPVPMYLMRLKDRERAQLLIEADERVQLNRFLWRWKQLFPKTRVNWTIEVDPALV